MILNDKRQLFDFFIVVVGTFILAVSVVVFFDANNLVLGGVSGLSIVIKEVFYMFFSFKLPLSINKPFYKCAFAYIGILYYG